MTTLELTATLFAATIPVACVAIAWHVVRIKKNTPMRDHERVNKIIEQTSLDAFVAAMSKPGPGEEKFFSDRRRRGVGVGLDEDGNLIQETGYDILSTARAMAKDMHEIGAMSDADLKKITD
ncbi:hypothetical protein [Celeribacter sp. PS-C1]|uniref:hypothetical protein n=1 Tax=Celeribacter sp. PS-C1 TaxID=2820813 RepID=UPI001CA5CB17|nr:hypothetical protein [Celeribacter sp. PS-C1]MBW6419652.1 hypothetical protein [Celeribacter sp. PS-C1]